VRHERTYEVEGRIPVWYCNGYRLRLPPHLLRQAKQGAQASIVGYCTDTCIVRGHSWIDVISLKRN